MTKNLTLLTLLIIASSCSDKTQADRPQVPWSGEWYPVNYTITADKAVHTINECSNNIGSFSAELDTFLSGNLVIGDIDHSDPNSTGFRGPFTWASRCNSTDRYEGTWDTQDYGATVGLKPTAMPDSTLQFNATSSSAAGIWKLTYAIGEEAVTIHYKLKRK